MGFTWDNPGVGQHIIREEKGKKSVSNPLSQCLRKVVATTPGGREPQKAGPGPGARGPGCFSPNVTDLLLQTWALMSCSTTVLSFPLAMPFPLPLFPTLWSLQGSVLGSLPFFSLQFLPQNSCFSHGLNSHLCKWLSDLLPQGCRFSSVCLGIIWNKLFIFSPNLAWPTSFC